MRLRRVCVIVTALACVLFCCAPVTQNESEAPGKTLISGNISSSGSLPQAGVGRHDIVDDNYTMPRGQVDPVIFVDIYERGLAYPGTTLLADIHDAENPRIIEVNLLGEVLWEYRVPYALRRFINPGFEAQRLPGDNILFILPRYGIFEVDRSGATLWSYLDGKISHDADRLENGNTLVVWGNDQKADIQAKEINKAGEVVWSWSVKKDFDHPPYSTIYADGWTHANAVSRLPGGNTLVSLRNFNLVAEIDPQGALVRTYGEGVFFDQHDPELLSNGHMLVANHKPQPPNNAVEIDPGSGQVVWSFGGSQWVPQLVRDADRLPNGNTLITGTNRIIEVTMDGKIVWQLRLKAEIAREQSSGKGFYKAQRADHSD
ncbi:MAG: aryl-sulfate sulfotransferase [Dehalococcoidia bacterium]|nr:aryl-sulfate sulfotransferase [Dehalococcoidia bacterium]MDD5495353.1 aryl-sulfate sulfotransferase [Dehalococcoidia bacterium]